jgi:hypothetical protein
MSELKLIVDVMKCMFVVRHPSQVTPSLHYPYLPHIPNLLPFQALSSMRCSDHPVACYKPHHSYVMTM